MLQGLEYLVQKMFPGCVLISSWELQGGISAQTTALEIALPDGQINKLVVRQPSAWHLKRNPNAAADEFKILQVTQSLALPTATPLCLDDSGSILSSPCIVLEYIEGEPEFSPSDVQDAITQMATVLARIHRADVSRLELSFLPKQSELTAEDLRERPSTVDESMKEVAIRDVLESVWPPHQVNKSVLLHGDFWPGNILWEDGNLVGLIDWEDAALGDPLADLAIGRLEVLFAFGADALDEFTRRYRSMNKINFDNLPYWDLCAALRPVSQIDDWAAGWSAQPINRSDVTEETMRDAHMFFVDEAFKNLSLQR